MTSPVDTPHRLRLVPAPPLDPPFDDELPPGPPAVAGTLALAFPPPSRGAVPLRLVPPAAGAANPDAVLPDARVWAGRLVQAIVEVLAGVRAVGQLAPFATLGVLEHLEASAGALAHRTARSGQQPPRPSVTSIHLCRLPGTAVEVCSVVDTGARRRALAFRLDAAAGRWRCTALELG